MKTFLRKTGAAATRLMLRRDSVPRWANRNDALTLLALVVVALEFNAWSSYSLVIGFMIAYTIVAASLVLLFGAAGQFSLAHAIFFAAGCFLAAKISSQTSIGLGGELAVAFVVGMLLGALLGLPSIRVGGLYLALATYALAYVGQQLLYDFSWLSGGPTGRSVGTPLILGHALTTIDFLYLALAIMALSCWLIRNLLRAKTGRAWRAVGTSESAAASIGLNVSARKVAAFSVSAGFAAVAGVIYAHIAGYIAPTTFDVQFSIVLLVVVLIGGRNRLWGAALGALFVVGLPQLFQSAQSVEDFLYGGAVVVLVLIAPGGLADLIEQLGRAAARHSPWSVGAASADSPAGGLHSVAAHSAVTNSVASTSAPKKLHGPSVGAELRIVDVTVKFGGVVAVDGVGLTVEAGSIVGLIGSNGAGKTTLFNAITGVVPARGHIYLDNLDVSGLAVHRRAGVGVGRTFQNLNLHEGLSPLDHVLLGMARTIRYDPVSEALRLPWVVSRERDAHARACAILEQLDLLDVADQTVTDLPYGLQKRVDVARALATSPRLLLLDEPAAGLPTPEALTMINMVRQAVDASGATLVLIEHNLEMVSSVCQKLIAMHGGRILATGSADSVLTHPEVMDAYVGVQLHA